MSIDYIVTPVTREFLTWGRECGVPIDLMTSSGGTVTLADLTRVLQSLDGFTHDIKGEEHNFSARLDSIEMYDWEYESNDPVMNQAFGGTHTSPRESISIDRLNVKNQSPALSLHGDITLVLLIARKLAQSCGPQAAFATCDGIPAFFLPDQQMPVWKEPWIDET
ncbi:hypothetical protein Pan153_58470 [Gimesia panareensis]|uniref:Uncharacterized protein n=1 Tax=Gimesia panareensis TaxID=2527978 RepID=A0A518FXR4_9PLAN|nr:hypothetical protein [Gimesia panareensis]QDV21165.1 hypothetical protein Pan153_58470 [Gimesia panareensis]